MYNNMNSITAIRGNKYFRHYYRYLQAIALQMFEWENLPPSIDPRFLEMQLHFEGKVAFVKHPKYGLIVARGTETGYFDIYGKPNQFECIFPNAQNNFRVNLYNYLDENPNLEIMGNSFNPQGVLIYNNDFGDVTIPTLKLFADDLAHIKQVMKINITNQKTPYIMYTNDKNLMSLKKLNNHMDSDASNIIVNEKLNLNELIVAHTPAPYVTDKLSEHLSYTWNEVMTFLGIENTNQMKKERMVVDEVNSNNEQTKASENIYLKARQEACVLINKLFDLNVSVKLRTSVVDEINNNIGKEVD